MKAMMMECPTSPTLYFSEDEPLFKNKGHPKNVSGTKTSDPETKLTRAEMAKCLLEGLEGLREIEGPSRGFEVNKFVESWNDEESVNLGHDDYSGFNLDFFSPTELSNAEAEFGPNGLERIEERHQLEEFSEIELGKKVFWDSEESSKKFDEEFQAILASIPNQTGSLYDKEVFDIAGINLEEESNEDLALVPLEHNDEEIDIEMEDLEEAANAAINFMNLEILLDNENENMEVLNPSGEIVLKNEPVEMSDDEDIYIIKSDHSPAGVDIEDEQASQAEKILDALLEGNLTKAESFLSPSQKQKQLVKVEAKPIQSAGRHSNVQQSNRKKKRGRKPGTQTLAAKSRRLRKKEQNKTAATRYRQKKKKEFVSMVDTETSLADENQELLQQKENIAREIKMVKQLMREVFDAKKKSRKRPA